MKYVFGVLKVHTKSTKKLNKFDMVKSTFLIEMVGFRFLIKVYMLAFIFDILTAEVAYINHQRVTDFFFLNVYLILMFCSSF